jgi:hypothetical protein
MEILNEKKCIPTQCYVNGYNKILTLEETYILFWQVKFAWLLLLDWFRSEFDGIEGSGYVSKLARFSGMSFGYRLLTRGFLALTINDTCMLDEHGYSPNRNTFIQNARRFGKLFPEKNRPYEATQVFDRDGNLQLAYRMKSDEKWLIIVGVDPKSEFTNEDINWSIFQTPPTFH